MEIRNKYITPLDRLAEIVNQLPVEVLLDIKSRMGDYVLGGGKLTDPYMWQQIRFAENWIKLNKTEDNHAITD